MIVLGFQNSSRIGFQTGVIYVPFHYSANLTDTILDETDSIDEQYATIRIPLDIQFRVHQSLSLLLGGFYDLPLATSIESDFGLRAGVSITIKISAKWGFAVQPSYQAGLRRFDGESNSEWSVLAGIRFGD